MLRSIFSNWVALVVTGAISVLLTPILIHRLGDFHYGMWILVGSLVEYSSFIDMGLRTTLQRFVAKLQGAHQRQALNETLGTSLALGLAVCLLLCVLTGVFAWVLPGFFGLSGGAAVLFAKVIVLLGLSVAVTFPARVLASYLCGLQRYDVFNLASIVTAVVRAVLVVAVLWLGYGVLACSVVTLGVAVVSLAVHWRLVLWADRELSLHWREASWARARELFNFSLYVFLASMGDFLRFRVDSFVIARWLTLALVTPFNIASRIMEYFKSVAFTVMGPLMTTMSTLEGQRRHHDLKRVFLLSTKVMSLISLFLGVMLWICGLPLIRLWVGRQYESAYIPLMILLVGYVVSLAQSPSINLLIACGRNRLLGWWTLTEGIANLALSIYWAPRYGLAGIALGTAVPQIFVKLTLQPWYALRVSGTSLREYVTRAVGGPLIATAAFLLLVYPLSRLVNAIGILQLLIAGSLGVLLYAPIAYFVALSASERQCFWERGRQFATSFRPARAA
jgi:O-antigen/teichoic acid export membrane protein